MTTFVNLTPHAIVLNDGTTFPPSGTVARVEQHYAPFGKNEIAVTYFGSIENLPDPAFDTIYITSLIVM